MLDGMNLPGMPLRDLALVLVICVVWAGNFIAGAQGMQHFPPFLFMVLLSPGPTAELPYPRPT